MKILFFALALFSWNIFGKAHASIVAVVDSGIDVNHIDLAASMWVNPVDLADNHYDEDQNGFRNDTHGWNFMENNDVLIDSRYVSFLTPDVRRFFEIQSDISRGHVDRASILWAKRRLRNRRFQRMISIYSGFMHGTHVSGIAMKGTRDSKLLGVKIETVGALNIEGAQAEEVLWGKRRVKEALSRGLELVIENFVETINYLDGHHTDIVNLSLGVGHRTLERYVSMYGGSFKNVSKFVENFLNKFIKEGRKMVARTPSMLFIIAAGNDGTDNDVMKFFPANINSGNTITVAATHEDRGLASFSNYGKRTVDIAAPGVAIRSTVPGDEYLSVSGTSQATPFVTRAASMVKDSNPSLTPQEIKEILMRTVTKKNFLKGKVVSEGVLHQERAVYAAELSNIMDLDSAITYSLREIEDPFVAKSNNYPNPFAEELKELVLPLPGLFENSYDLFGLCRLHSTLSCRSQ